jgi:preprotein translocase subunit SecG
MSIVFIILLVIAAVALGFVVLVQNPKGGGLSDNVAGVSNQLMGVKQTTDVLEKGTWIFAGLIGLLALCSVFFFRGKSSLSSDATNAINKVSTTAPAAKQATPAAAPAQTPAPTPVAPKQ